MRALAVLNEEDAGPGVFGEFEVWRPASEPVPAMPDALLVFGGSMHVDQNDEHPWLDVERALIGEALSLGVPILGVCLGSQLLAEVAGAFPYRSDEPEVGWFDVEVTKAGAADPVIGPLAPSAQLFVWHHYVAPVPPGGVELARTPLCPQAFRIEGKPAWGVQFHAEVTREILFGWLDGFDRSEAASVPGLDPERIKEESERRIDEQVRIGRGIAKRFLAEAARTAPERTM